MDDNFKQIGSCLPSTSEAGLSAPLTADLDLTSLPERLDDQTLATVEYIASLPAPPPIPCDKDRFSQCMRLMISVLPRRRADEVTGELFVAAYEQSLSRFSNGALEYMARRATDEKKWFPTIKECLDILEDWRRPSYETAAHNDRRKAASQLAGREHEARREDSRQRRQEFLGRLARGEIPQAEINAMPDDVVWRLRQENRLVRDQENQRFVPNPDFPAGLAR